MDWPHLPKNACGLVHGYWMSFGPPGGAPTASNGGAGYALGIPRLGILAIQMADAATRVTRGAGPLFHRFTFERGLS